VTTTRVIIGTIVFSHLDSDKLGPM
jgi:hypothetical protein